MYDYVFDHLIVTITLFVGIYYALSYSRPSVIKWLANRQFKRLGVKVPEDYMDNIENGSYDEETLRESILFTIFQASHMGKMTSIDLEDLLYEISEEYNYDKGIFSKDGLKTMKEQIFDYIKSYERYVSSREDDLDEIEAFAQSRILK